MTTSQRELSSSYIQGGIPEIRRHRSAVPELLRSNTLPTKINLPRQRDVEHSSNQEQIYRNRISRNRRNQALLKRDSLESNRSDNSDPGIDGTDYTVSRTKTVGQLRRRQTSFSMSSRDRISSFSPSRQQRSQSLDQETSLSTPSIILTKMRSMKDKIHRQVVQTVQIGDWPPPRVMFNDRHVYSSSVPTTIKRKRGSRNQLERSSSVTRSTKTSSSRSSMSENSFSTKSLSSSGNGGIVCSELDFKAIIVGYRQQNSRESFEVKESDPFTENEVNQKTKSETKLNENRPQKRWIRKQVSFDDKERVIPTERKVSAIAEEIEAALIEKDSFLNTRRGSGLNDKPIRRMTLTAEDSAATVENSSDLSESIHEIQRAETTVVNSSTIESLSSETKFQPKDVEFDEFGQTWEVYGADPDPEILGQAIQYHLEHLMIHQHTLRTDDDNDGTEDEADNSKSLLEKDDSGNGFKRFWSRLFCIADRETGSSTESTIPTKRAMYGTEVC